MSEQPPVQPPNQPSKEPAEGNPPTLPMPAAANAPPVGPTASPSGPPSSSGMASGPPATPPGPPAGTASAEAPQPNVWRRATSTTGRRVALALSAAALAGLLLLSIVIGGIVVLRHDDRVDLAGNRQDRHFLGQDDKGNGNGNGNGKGNGKFKGQGPGSDDDKDRQNPAMPGMPGGRDGLGGLGNRLGGAGLHGAVTATVDGTVQSLLFQRGEVTAVSATSITLKSTDGFTGTYGRNASTKANGVAPVKGGQAFVLARASDKVALRTISTPAKAGAAPSS